MTVKIFSNNKPYISKDTKTTLNKKKYAFKNNLDKEAKREIQKEIERDIRIGKQKYKEKVQQHFTENNMKKVWDGMSLMAGYKGKGGGGTQIGDCSEQYANDLNQFYCRFECHDFSKEREQLKKDLSEGLKGEGDETPLVEERDVRTAFKKVNSRKAAGPDNITPKLLKTCADQLAGIFTLLFNLSFHQASVPKLWKTSCVVPVPKKHPIKALNDLRPVALTSVPMKIFEKFMLKRLRFLVSDFIDPLQFAYRSKRNVEDAVLYVLNKMFSHLENANSSIRLMFFDFSSAFNTMQCHLLVNKLLAMNVDFRTVLWIFDYLTFRPQFVKLRSSSNSNVFISDTVFTNTGAPQGTVLAPFLFSLYTSDHRQNHDSCPLIKFADDTALSGLISDNDDLDYKNEISQFVNWCDENFLDLNVSKTKEMIIDFRKGNKCEFDDILIKGQTVEKVSTYKYLGVVIDDQLSWKENTDYIHKRLQSRSYVLSQKIEVF